MKTINIETLNKKIFKLALQEESERQTITQNMIKSQIEDGVRFDGDEDVVLEIDRLKESFNKISRKRKSVFEISDEEFMFLERMIKNQTITSNSRLDAWGEDGEMTNYFKSQYFMRNKDATEEKFEECRSKIIKCDIDLKECMKELLKILDVD